MSSNHEFYLARAAEAHAEAERASLHNIRERCLRAAAAWEAMAARAGRAERMRAETETRKAAEAELLQPVAVAV